MAEKNLVQENETKKVSFEQPWRVFTIEAFLFLFTLTIGIVTAIRIRTILDVRNIEIPQISFWRFVLSFIGTTLLILIIIRFLKFKKQKGTIFRLLFVLAVFWGGALLLSAWISDAPSLFLMGFLILWWWKWPSILIQDICVILGIAGVGSVLGLALTPELVIIFLIIFSIYDFIAVYKTKHMVQMAKEMIKSKAILALVVPSNISGFQEDLGQLQSGGKSLVLGGGDIVFPLLFSVSLISSGILNSVVVALFSLIGLLAGFLFFISQKRLQPIPALPPIALFSIIGYLLTKIF